MAHDTPVKDNILHDLGDGLLMHRATPSDGERLAYFHANTLLDIGEVGPNERLHAWMLDLMSGDHPTLRAGDFTFVEDSATGKIVSSIGHFSQTWTYEGIPFPFGQPEIVSTDPAYRRRGLVRAQFNEVHRWSAERGELVQGITGIPWYYRQFGYEMAVNLGGARTGFKPHVPKLKEGEVEPYRIRPATREDVAFIRGLYERGAARSMLASVRDDALWLYDLEGRSEKSDFRNELLVIETWSGGEPVGALAHSTKLSGPALATRLYEVKSGVPWLATTPSVLRYLAAKAEEYARRDSEEFEALAFVMGAEHPVYDTIAERLPRVRRPYAWYIRVPDLPAFVSRIAPALEKRLAASPQGGYTGEMKVSFYRGGLLFKFDKGNISVESWKPQRAEEGDSAFPDLTFLQILFGYRNLEELQHAFPDCTANTDDARALLLILFPKKASNVWAGG